MKLKVIRAMKKSTSKCIENESIQVKNQKKYDDIFLNIITRLEGNNKLPVDHRVLVEQLQNAKFRKNKAENYIRMMLRKAKIYESKPNCYNTT